MNENKLKEVLYNEQQNALIYGNMKRLKKINIILYHINCREKLMKETLKNKKNEIRLEKLAEIYSKRGINR